MTENLLCIGTKKGLFLARSRDRKNWVLDEDPYFPMSAVYATAIDLRGGRPRVFASVDHPVFGPAVLHSDDLGRTWSEATEKGIRFPEGYDASVERVWQLRPDEADRPGVVWAGAEPSSLWRSEDGGETFALVEALWNHPHRPEWQPGFGGQAIHTIIPDRDDPRTVVVAMSTGGVYRTEDGGRSWHPSNAGIRAAFMPEGQQYPEFGQCVHKIAADAERRDRFYLQNHGGVYRSDDGGRSWSSIAEGLPADFGFAVAAHPRRGGTVFLFPLQADIDRFPAGRHCRVYRSRDAGGSWQPLTEGLPDEPDFGIVLRDALCVDNADAAGVAGVYFGNRSGEVYASPDEGDHWVGVASHLPDVLCVRAAVLS
ncbi:WD40/YVTN/BNR-like repeat-containing protein [Phaeacidiphilus oryzae]|uniref:WD40/YVTN/BNR-like repeat-containing protein n=1 Tax=Phaeacidiphilus oryzae TaxID=348818 RepID=UPI00055B71FE|nr:glycosyl hydrolase [Phaeacidiphilus oryzae]